MEDNIRPWGRYDILFEDDNCKVKQITVNPNSKLSYQYHEKRKECWVVTQGQLTLVLNEAEKTFNPGMNVVIYPGDKHRAWNKQISQSNLLKYKQVLILERMTS